LGIIRKKLDEELGFRRSTTLIQGSLKEIPDLRTYTVDSKLSSSEEGAFSIQQSENIKGMEFLFKSKKIVLWKQIFNTTYVLICEKDENRALGVHFLSVFIKMIDDHFKKPGISAQPKEYLSKPEDFIGLLQTFLPNGQLLFMNNQFIKHLKKEAEVLILAK